MKKDVKINHVLLILIVAILSVSLILCLVFFLPPKDEEKGSDEQIHYYVADYEEDIFQNKAYMSFERGLLFSSGGVDQLFHYDINFSEASPECQFFLEYFHSVILGEYDSVSDFYIDGYFEKEPKFTMQMIYEPYVMFHSVSEEEIDGEKAELLNFHVRYKIFRNNGTFREGVASNIAVPQIYQILKMSDGSFRIYRILEVENES